MTWYEVRRKSGVTSVVKHKGTKPNNVTTYPGAPNKQAKPKHAAANPQKCVSEAKEFDRREFIAHESIHKPIYEPGRCRR